VGALSPGWLRVTLVGVCASAALFVGTSVWHVLGHLAPVLGLFFGGWLLSCVLEPLVGWLMRRTRAQHSTAVQATYVLVFVALTLVWIGAAPGLASQISGSVTSLPAQADAAAQRALAGQALANAWFSAHGVGIQLDLASSLSLDSLARLVSAQLEATASSPLAVLSAAMGVLGSLAMMLLLSVFFLVGGPQLADQVTQAFGGRAAADVRFVLLAVHDSFEGFMRAQLLQGGVFAGCVWACLAVAQVDAAPLIGAAAGILLLVPVIGAILAVLVPVLATVFWQPTAILAVGAALVLLEQLVLNVLGPRLMSQRLGLPPLLVFFGVLVGGQVGGVWGAVFGIPALAALLACADHFRPRWSSEQTPLPTSAFRMSAASDQGSTGESSETPMNAVAPAA
jgi:predicted PurR-regulated permease PerM